MESILEAINEWIKEILIGAINGNLSTMFGDVNEKVGTIAAAVGLSLIPIFLFITVIIQMKKLPGIFLNLL